jgi:FkbM family methyltransferase
MRRGAGLEQARMNQLLRRRMRRLRFLPRLVRSVRKRIIRFVHGDEYFVAEYYGARFLVRRRDMVAREIALQNFERPQLEYMISACSRFRPDLFIDVGANGGLYSCVLLKQRLVPRAILFEPDRRNFAHLSANLLINGLTEVADSRQVAVGAAPGRLRLVPGEDSNTGASRIVADSESGYDVEAVRIDDAVALSGGAIAVKMDVEEFELRVIAGMGRTLRENRGIVQIETTTNRMEVVELMRTHGYVQTADFFSDLVFEKP